MTLLIVAFTYYHITITMPDHASCVEAAKAFAYTNSDKVCLDVTKNSLVLRQ